MCTSWSGPQVWRIILDWLMASSPAVSDFDLNLENVKNQKLTFSKSCKLNDDLSEVGQKDLGLGSRECGLTSRQKIFVHKTEVHHIDCPRFLSTRSLSTRVRSTTFAIAGAFTAVVSFARPRDRRQFSPESDFSNTNTHTHICVFVYIDTPCTTVWSPLNYPKLWLFKYIRIQIRI